MKIKISIQTVKNSVLNHDHTLEMENLIQNLLHLMKTLKVLNKDQNKKSPKVKTQ